MSFANYTTYLSKFDKCHTKQVENLYKEKFLICIRHAHDSQIHYVKGRVAAEMKKKIVYNVDISFDDNGVICECQCDCGAGMGPDAHCKHVSVVIYGLPKFSVNAAIDVQVTCTGNLQRFCQAKRFKGSPVKAHKFILTQKPATPNSIATISSCDPRPAEYRNMKNDQNFVRNASLNFQYLGNEMPVCQLYEPANLYAVAHDHDYLKYSPEEMFLQKMNKSAISGSAIEEIETNTRGQCKNRRWVRERLFRITSSNFGRICKENCSDKFRFISKGNAKDSYCQM